MKIKKIETYTVGVPPPFKGGFNWVFIKLVPMKELKDGESATRRLLEKKQLFS